MLSHYLLISFRSILKYKRSFIINLIGLSTGLTFSLFIYFWVADELNVNSYHEKRDQLFQVMVNEPLNNGIETQEFTPGPLAKTMADELPEVEYGVSVVEPISFYNGVLSENDNYIKVRPQFVDKDYFQAFTCVLLQGDKHAVLGNPQSILLSAETAVKLFPNMESCVGRIVEFKNEYFSGVYTVSGIFDRPAGPTTERFDVIFSYDLFLEKRPEVRDWNNAGPATFIVLRKGTDVEEFNTKIKDFIKHKPGRKHSALFAQQYSKKYLYGVYENGVPVGGRVMYVTLFSTIAVFILFIACINYMNLSTARASVKLKEIGVKKAVGAARSSLFMQYMGESMVISFLSVFTALGLVALLLPGFNRIAGKHIVLNFSIELVLIVLCVAILTGLLAGSYPALYLSGFNPGAVLKGKLKTSIGELWVRKGLVVFQFSTSVILIVSVLVVDNQMQFIQTKNLGYNRDNVISFPLEGNLTQGQETFFTEVKKVPGVIDISFSGELSSRRGGLLWDGKHEDEASSPQFYYMDASYDLIHVLGIEVKEGRSFSREFGSDSTAIIFNEAAIEAMGIKDPIGKTVDFYGKREIIGVVKNFHFESLYEKVKPFFFKMDKNTEGNVFVKIKGGEERRTIDAVQQTYSKFNKGFPFDYRFLDEDFQAQYEAETRVAVLSRYFAGVAILISCLGLFGLTAFATQRRTKEIGIRKVLGAGDFHTVRLLSRDFIKMVLISQIVGLPISYFIVKSWLDHFQYRIEMSPWYFLAAAVITLIIAVVTVGMQTMSATKVNLTESLRINE